jgi:hypothetical protein
MVDRALLGSIVLDSDYDDLLQKTWTVEGTKEYHSFKQITRENSYLAKFIRDNVEIPPGRVLDIGGREGSISFNVSSPSLVDIVDPDPTIRLDPPATYVAQRIQNYDLSARDYSLIICSHVLGYLGRQNAQRTVLRRALAALATNASCVLSYNINVGYMGDLLRFSRLHIENGHFDYFEEGILDSIDPTKYSVTQVDVSFPIYYPSYYLLGRACWFLFGNILNNVDEVARLFEEKIRGDGMPAGFNVDQRILRIERL